MTRVDPGTKRGVDWITTAPRLVPQALILVHPRTMRLAVLAAIGVLASAVPADAHIEMTSPAPRELAQKAGPCGNTGSKRGTKVTAFRPGQTITVEWDETVDHPGHFRLAFDESGNDSFQDPNRPDDNFPQTLADQIADRSGGGHYSQQITLPNISCTNCTLQLMQIMTTAVPYDSFYFQCADLVLGDGGDPEPTGPTETEGGCATGSSVQGLAAGLAVLGLALRRRRHRRC
jgi:hypothetical protein